MEDGLDPCSHDIRRKRCRYRVRAAVQASSTIRLCCKVPTACLGCAIGRYLQACKYIEQQLAIPTSSLGAETLMAAAKTAMSSKIVGADSDFFGRIVVDAVTAVKSEDEETGRYDLQHVSWAGSA